MRLSLSLAAPFALALTLALGSPSASWADDHAPAPAEGAKAFDADGPFDAEERAAIESILLNYLRDNPGIVLEALETLEERQRAEEERQRAEAMAALTGTLDSMETVPTFGDEGAPISVIEFFDYNCPYCRRVAAQVIDLPSRHPDVRVYFVELPVLGEESVLAARAAMAARIQGKYLAFHTELMAGRGRASREAIMEVAEKIGLDLDQMWADMDSPAVTDAIEANLDLSQRLGVRGTPAFVIGDELFPGAIPLERMDSAIEAARQG